MLIRDTDYLPDLLLGIAPIVGSVWHWEPLKPHASCVVTVTEVAWNGEECWIVSEDAEGRHWPNELSRWVEATVFIRPAPGLE